MNKYSFTLERVKGKYNLSARSTDVPPTDNWRYWVVGALFFGMMFLLFVRAIYLQVIDYEYLQSEGKARYLRELEQPAIRGVVLDRNETPIAISTPVQSIWLHPPTILAQLGDYSYQRLCALLGIDRQEFIRNVRSRRNKQFMYLKRQVSPRIASQILALEIPGISSTDEFKRYYPTGPVFAHLLGFTNIDGKGQEGIELAFDRRLLGRSGSTKILKDKYGKVVEYVEQVSSVDHGEAVQLSIDSRIQYLAWRHLQASVKKHQAESASLVALNAKTGEVLAMVSFPDYNPNNRRRLNSDHFRNRSITDVYEPGSTMKPFTVAMALDKTAVTPSSVIDTSPGQFYVGRNKISDTKNHGELTVTEVVKKSSNIGSAKIAFMLPPEDLYETYSNLGFGEANDLPVQGEQKGILVKRKQWRPIEHATLSYGYGLAVTTLQLARAYQALANNGVLLPISIIPIEGVPAGKQVFSKGSVLEVSKMLELASGAGGTAPKAQVKQYRVAGKTGTTHRLGKWCLPRRFLSFALCWICTR